MNWIRLARWPLGLFNITIPIRVGKSRFVAPLSNGNMSWPSEPWMAQLLRQVLPLWHGMFVDVGVNLGQTLLKVKSVDPAKEYLGFEPNPVCVAYVNRLIKMNGLSDCSIIPAAAGPSATTLKLDLYGSETNPGASLVPGFRDVKRVTHRVSVVVLPPVSVPALADKRIGILKIDVEGGELEVVEAFVDIIRRDRPLILLEVLPCRGSDAALRIARRDKLTKLVVDEKYSVQRIQKSGGRLIGMISVSDFDSSDLDQSDYMLSPQ